MHCYGYNHGSEKDVEIAKLNSLTGTTENCRRDTWKSEYSLLLLSRDNDNLQETI